MLSIFENKYKFASYLLKLSNYLHYSNLSNLKVDYLSTSVMTELHISDYQSIK